ncbi:MAG: hypothetical protein CVV41_07055 [Candidatus Riflebacteria bacterium HGW-Riflebacteria-1]|nr:MAG: hypothetical protein CVV41_07055 [Candidatus Riflebacteria bacterium HGW-Riflebacteria-1]
MKMTIENRISALVAAYQRLSQANKRFIEQGCGVEAFRNLIEQRELILEDLPLLSQELVAAMEQSFPGHQFSCNSVTEAVRTISVIAPHLENCCNDVRDALKQLVESDLAVENNISTLKDEIKAELGRVRQGSRGLKGYRQSSSYGSCFINKVK